MTTAQVAFLVGLVAVLGSVGLFSLAVFRSAVRGGRAAGLGLFGSHVEHSRLGRGAFVAHRLTGVGIFAFLCLHILDVALLSVSHRLYDQVQPLYGSAPLRVLECGLLVAILFHTGNGLRLIAVDLVPLSARWAERLLRAVIAVAVVAGALGSIVILGPAV